MKPRFIVASSILALTLGSSHPAAARDISGDLVGRLNASDSPFWVIGDLRVPPNQVLIVEPGCDLMFTAGTGLLVHGTLVVQGTSARPVAFRPEPSSNGIGQWEGLTLDRGVCVLSHASISRAQVGVRVGPTARLDATSLRVSESQGDGISFDPGAMGSLAGCRLDMNGGTGVRITDCSPSLSGVAFENNDRPVTLRGQAFPAMSGLSASGHASSPGIVVETDVPITRAGHWTACGLPYVLLDGSRLHVDPEGMIVINGGTVVKMGLGAGIEIEGMVLALEGADQTLLTSLRDESVLPPMGQETSGTLPAKGDWDALEVWGGGSLRMVGTAVRHADDGVRALGGSTVTMVRCEVSDALTRGLAFGPGSAGYLEACVVRDNGIGLYAADAMNVIAGPTPGDTSAGRNLFACNAAADVMNESATELPARGNFWGTTPPDSTRFYGPVDYASWLTDAPSVLPSPSALRVARVGLKDLTFYWGSAGACVGHRLLMDVRPDGPFAVIAGPTYDEWHFERDGALLEGPVTYFKLATAYDDPAPRPLP